ncbi:uncharacterized protein LOC143211609 [Lasioglossum baleicum]|uniref:uncharacterized protein LOC143211609 n=1 Tax=Lasioglossum baleicum TaxID=434251 RepID=UPI003FCE2F4B
MPERECSWRTAFQRFHRRYAAEEVPRHSTTRGWPFRSNNRCAAFHRRPWFFGSRRLTGRKSSRRKSCIFLPAWASRSALLMNIVTLPVTKLLAAIVAAKDNVCCQIQHRACCQAVAVCC